METPCAAYLCAVESPIPNSFFVHVSIPLFLLILFLIAVLLIVSWTNILLTPIVFLLLKFL